MRNVLEKKSLLYLEFITDEEWRWTQGTFKFNEITCAITAVDVVAGMDVINLSPFKDFCYK